MISKKRVNTLQGYSITYKQSWTSHKSDMQSLLLHFTTISLNSSYQILTHARGGWQGPTPAQLLNVVSSYFLFQVKLELGATTKTPIPFDHYRRPGRAIYCTIRFVLGCLFFKKYEKVNICLNIRVVLFLVSIVGTVTCLFDILN